MGQIRHILSSGGGVNSTALIVWLLDKGQPLDEVVIADTGGEFPETYAHLELVRSYLADRGVPLTVLPATVRGRDLYQTSIDRKVLPSTIWRWCTRDFKVKPIHRYYRTLNAHINQYLAIAYDEFERMRTSRESYVTNLYPLVDERITRANCEDIIRQAGLPIPIKSSCFFCPFGTLERWKLLHTTHPDLYEKAIALEENSKHFPSQRLSDQVFRERAQVTLRQLPSLFETTEDLLILDSAPPCGAECQS